MHVMSKLLRTYVDTSLCLQEIDENWKISWPDATRGKVVQQPCRGGTGMYVYNAYFNPSSL